MTETGAVLGIDVGFSERSASTAFCLLRWDASSVRLQVVRVGTGAAERARALNGLLVAELPALTVALDGPLTHGLAMVRHYRTAEALFSQGVFQKRGKPGQTSSPTGLSLHSHATSLATMVLEAESAAHCRIAPASHREAIHEKAIVEAFPNQFLAALLPEVSLPKLHRDASDRYWEACIRLDRFRALLECLLPGRELDAPLDGYSGHDDRAAIICALTALSVCTGEAVGVGDAVDGDIMLPPPACWGAAQDGTGTWMEHALRHSLTAVRETHAHGRTSRINKGGRQWMP